MTPSSELILVCAPRGRDGDLATKLLERYGMRAETCESIDHLATRMSELGCAVVTAEALTVESRAALRAALAAQPPWSDFPLILFAPHGARSEAAIEAERLLGNVTVLERPVHGATLISAIVAALRARRRQYEAREAIHRRDQFLAMLGHELRNPLAAIVLALETLPVAAGDRGERQRAVIERQTRHLARLVDDLLDVARVTSGKVTLKRELVDLADIVHRCVQGAELAARARSTEVRVSCAGEPLLVDGDLVRLEEVFNNLLVNAIKYSPEHGRVEVRARREGATCVVEVRDHGIGIATEMLPRVFELFAQASPSLDRSQGGLGIGLTLVHALIELHGGTITAESPGLGDGSTFTVRLPAARAGVVAQPPQAAPADDGLEGTRIVIVEDNADLLDMTRDLLEVMACTVATAADGPKGVEQILATEPDVAFVDIGLPGLDGYQIAQQVRATCDRPPYLVAMTGYGQPEDRRRALDAGFDEHLTKPVTAGTLKQAILKSRARV